jgi:glycosyltransferase involved in cell wall biosynthesis
VPSDPVNPAVASISAFFPCCNDEPTIASMVRLAFATLERVGADGEVIVIDDGSADGSPHVLKELTDLYPRLRVITHERTRGYGGALIAGFGAATQQWVFYTDGDAQFDPSELELLVAGASDDVDVVQGYKLRRADSLGRRIVGRLYHRFVRVLFGLRVRDTDCDFRLIRAAALDRIRLVHTSGVICVELVRKLQDSGARFVEVPVHHYPRVHGQSQFFRPGRVGSSLVDLAGLWLRLVVLRRRSAGVGTGGEDERRGSERDVGVA